jgi:hypothetical protein
VTDFELAQCFGLDDAGALPPPPLRAMTLAKARKVLSKCVPVFQISVQFWQFAPDRQTLEYVIYDAGRQEHFRGASLAGALAQAIAKSKSTLSPKDLAKADATLAELPLVA